MRNEPGGQFTLDYKLRIIAQADACKHGELGALLRREKLYSNQLGEWRCEYAKHGIEGLSQRALEPRASKTPEQCQNKELRKENERLRSKLAIANDCLELQKKTLSMLDRLHNGNVA